MAITFSNVEELKDFADKKRKEGKKIVFTNGCFDIIHAGHIDYLEKAKSFGDILIVGVNSDTSIKRIKGGKRPIIPEQYRIRVLKGLNAIDGIIVFNEKTPLNIIKALEPDILVKGADWPLEKIVGREYAKKVERIEFAYDISTSKIIEKILKIHGCK
ncbi:D-glycero-beta-D-manno-heptose 1-phosphate adenylyltransferase [Desulfurobacterium indicum]|uniref:D-glycero-beta-D-manno-heptose 1-phosphate adenylyltransferase n=1 Tax=Desulfurobacterium indicum TaxID=1914305 RepID=A0A1R1MNL7_9BACT|nr:D-glycero-beta-D-manno-heptose 1-phosphate adenylyltransferase [Desulfurobacterium indicum]OMH41422.1 glycerol-3-phosphate cytidylyltransferase [Desulfurobacterium indicum]